MESFSLSVSKFAKKTASNLDEAGRAIKVSLFSSIIQDTRVDTGRLRGNWQTSTGGPKVAVIDRKDKIGDISIREVKENVSAFGVDYLTNNLPYALVMEEKDGMVSKNTRRIERIVKGKVKDVTNWPSFC